MTEERQTRINHLAAKAKTAEGLTEEEKAEQAELRKAHVADVRANFASMLENTYIVDERGNKTKLQKKRKG